MVTAVWQSELVRDDIRNYGMSAGAFAFAVAASPMRNQIGTILLILFAAGFELCGMNYAIKTESLVKDRGDDAMATVRLFVWILGLVGAAVMMFSVLSGSFCHQQLSKAKPPLPTSIFC